MKYRLKNEFLCYNASHFREKVMMKNLSTQEKNDLDSFVFNALGQSQKTSFWAELLAKIKAFFARLFK